MLEAIVTVYANSPSDEVDTVVLPKKAFLYKQAHRQCYTQAHNFQQSVPHQIQNRNKLLNHSNTLARCQGNTAHVIGLPRCLLIQELAKKRFDPNLI